MFHTDPHPELNTQGENNSIQNDVKFEYNQLKQPSDEEVIIDDIEIIEETNNKSIVAINHLQNTYQNDELTQISIEDSPLHQEEGEEEKIEVKNVTVNIKGKEATICAEIGNYICKFTVPLRVLNKLHTLLGLGVSWATIVVSLAVAYWPNVIYKNDCSINPNISVMQDPGKQIFMGTFIARTVPLPLIHMVMSKIAESCGKKSSFERITTIIESLENTGLLTAGALACIGLNPLIPQTSLANYAYIPASLVAGLPVANLIYSLWNLNHFRGAWQDYKKQYSHVKAIILTTLESFFGATTAASLTGIIGQVVYNTMINAARDVNVPQDEMNKVLIISTVILAGIGAMAVLDPTLWKGINAISAGAGVFYAVYNMPVAVLACLYPEKFTPHNYANGGWSLETIPGAVALALMLSTTAATYRELSEINLKGHQALAAQTSNASQSYFNEAKDYFWSFFKCGKNESNRELSEIPSKRYEELSESQPLLLEKIVSPSTHESAHTKTSLYPKSYFSEAKNYVCSFFKCAKNENLIEHPSILTDDERNLNMASHT